MRLIAVAALAACLSGAAWAGERTSSRAAADDIDVAAISQVWEGHYKRAFAAEEANLRAAAISNARAEVSQAMSELESQLAVIDRRLGESDDAMLINADLEQALGRAERAVQRASAELDHTEARLRATAN